MNQEIWSAFSMTEPQGGSDPSLFKTEAVRDGDQWVINGEKWFTSFGEDADIILVMCSNGIFIVEQGTPGIEWLHGAGGRTRTSATTMYASHSTISSDRKAVVGCSRNAASVVAESTTQCGPSPRARRPST